MEARELLQALQTQDNIDQERIQEIFDQLPSGASVGDFREQIIAQGVLPYGRLMTIFMEQNIMPRGKRLMQRLQTAREQRTHFAPERHSTKFHIDSDDSLTDHISLADEGMAIGIPRPVMAEMTFSSSDEKQAVSLAVEMADMGEAHECEEILLEVVESFEKSVPAIFCLCWLYLCTGHAERAEYWANYLLQGSASNTPLLEMLTLAEQAQSKHLLAAAHLQRLLQNKTVKAIWYLLLAYSLEKSQCQRDAIDNYRIYTAIAADSPLKNVAKAHLEELQAS